MIVIFHYIINCFYTYLKKINCKTVLPNFAIDKHLNDPFAERTVDNNIKFDPPLYKQRYQRVAQLLLDERWRSKIRTIVDFGCAELDLFVYLKNLNNLNRTIFVDIDEELLTESLFKVQPLIADHINRSHELNVEVYVGSVAEPDDCLKDIDAVIAIELIEHLYPDVLEAIPYNIFGYIRPKLAILTTPNVEFNELFPDKKQFRHIDHKFEWTREQFQSWSLNIAERFPDYTVAFDGIGTGPHGTESLGTCTQIAVFVRKDIICDTVSNKNCITLDGRDCIPKNSYGICSYYSYSKQLPAYKLITNLNYPYLVDNRTEEEKILDEIKYRINLFNHTNSMFYNYSKNRLELPLEQLIYGNYGQFITISELRGLLLKSNYTVEECSIQATDRQEICLIINLEMDNDDATTTNSDIDASGYESDNKLDIDDEDDHYSDWEDNHPNSSQNNDENNKQQQQQQQQCSLYDSGYQKSPQNDESPNDNVRLLTGTVLQQQEITQLPADLLHKEAMKQICEELAKHHQIAGPSNIRKILSKESSIDSDDNSSLNDVKSLTNCIIENSLNKIAQPQQDQQLIIEQPFERQLEPVMIVENGDLANNNRDVEGNNYPAPNDDDHHHHHDDNHDELIDNQRHNHVNIDNNNEVIIDDDLIEENEHVDDEQEDAEIAWPSREALFDSSSHIDLLDDFEMDAVQNDESIIDSGNYLLINSNVNSRGNDDAFPSWLLALIIENDDGENLGNDDIDDGSHFYSQGDGLVQTRKGQRGEISGSNPDGRVKLFPQRYEGVHPSTISIDDDDDIDDDADDHATTTTTTTTTTSSASGSTEVTQETQENPDVPVQQQSSSEDEFLESVIHKPD